VNFQRKILALSLIIFFTTYFSFAQTIPVNKYGLQVVEDIELYKKIIEKDSNKILVDLEKFIPDIVLDIRYATKNNFTKKVLYPKPKAFLRYNAAVQLKKIQQELKQKNLGLKIYDAYRPYSITLTLWDFVKDDRYAADPKKGSRHNRGCAVDLTIIDLTTGKEIQMPTPYDDFTVKAHHSYMNLPKKLIENRKLLKTTMEKYGFASITSEWWHYDFNGWKNFELLDISFDNLELLK